MSSLFALLLMLRSARAKVRARGQQLSTAMDAATAEGRLILHSSDLPEWAPYEEAKQHFESIAVALADHLLAQQEES